MSPIATSLHVFTLAAPDTPPPVGAGPDLTGYLLVCGGLIGAIALLAFGFRRLFGGALRQRAAKRSLTVIDMLPLGGRRRLAVVRCYDRTFALGLGDKEISLVAELDLDDSPAEIVKRLPRPQEETFAEELDVAQPAPPPGRAPEVAEKRRPSRAHALLARMREGGVLG